MAADTFFGGFSLSPPEQAPNDLGTFRAEIRTDIVNAMSQDVETLRPAGKKDQGG